MFNGVERLPIMVEMIIETTEDRTAARKTSPQSSGRISDQIFEVMAPRPVTIRLLDPPIHEFLPTERQLVDEIKELRNLRETIKGMQVLSDAARFMNFPELKSRFRALSTRNLSMRLSPRKRRC